MITAGILCLISAVCFICIIRTIAKCARLVDEEMEEKWTNPKHK